MYDILNSILLIILVLVITPLLYRGVKLRTKLIEIDTTKNRERVDSVSSYHMRQYRKLKEDIVGYVSDSRKEYKAFFRSNYALFLGDIGIDTDPVVLSKEKLLYKVTLDKSLTLIFQKMVSDAICNNHFPQRKIDSDGNFVESSEEFEDRFYREYTLPLTETILGLTTDFVDEKWESTLVSRKDFKANYIYTEKQKEHIYMKFSALIVKCRKQRNHIFDQIIRNDGSELQTLFDEWEIMYG